jgi:hypothetical protein
MSINLNPNSEDLASFSSSSPSFVLDESFSAAKSPVVLQLFCSVVTNGSGVVRISGEPICHSLPVDKTSDLRAERGEHRE